MNTAKEEIFVGYNQKSNTNFYCGSVNFTFECKSTVMFLISSDAVGRTAYLGISSAAT